MMVYTDARVAWHDSMHEYSLSITAASMSQAQAATKQTAIRRQTIEAVFAAQGEDKEARIQVARQKLDAKETRGDRFDSTKRAARIASMAKVQAAIKGQPLRLQQFGNLLYAPTATTVELECSRYLLARFTPWPAMSVEKAARAQCLVLPALLSYRGTAFGGHQEWAPGRITEFVASYDEHIAVANWSRDWAEVWERLLNTAAIFDQQALAPVWAVINAERRGAANDG